jgi:F0F1-type ATP synthase assembly protein I
MKEKNTPGEHNDTEPGNTLDQRKRKSGAGAGLEALVLFSQLGLTMALPIILGALAGHWLDGKFGTRVIFLLIFVCLGVTGGIAGAYRQITMVTKGKERRTK